MQVRVLVLRLLLLLVVVCAVAYVVVLLPQRSAQPLVVTKRLPLAFLPEHVRANQTHPYWRSLVRAVPASCKPPPPSPLDAVLPRLSLLPGFFDYMRLGNRPRVLVVDSDACRTFALAEAAQDMGESVEAVLQRAVSKCRADAPTGRCVIAVLETCWQDDFQKPQIAYPGLLSQPIWHNGPMAFPEAAELEANFADIESEFDKLIRLGALKMHPETLAKEGDWRVFTLWSAGREHANNTAVTPRTAALWRRMNERFLRTRRMTFGLVYFSVLVPGAKLAGHFGSCNMRLRHHLGIHVPVGASITLSRKELLWQRGKVISFDDSFGHEVANRATTGRAVLIADFWHPQLELRPEELHALVSHFEAIIPQRESKDLKGARDEVRFS
jgi:aspartyl/asparaginyl beta-hydroxylase (cupin superfamily)